VLLTSGLGGEGDVEPSLIGSRIRPRLCKARKTSIDFSSGVWRGVEIMGEKKIKRLFRRVESGLE